MNDSRTQQKKTYTTPEIVEIGQLNSFIRGGGLSYTADGMYIQNGMRYTTFDPIMGSTP
jgi:hypothetical protein